MAALTGDRNTLSADRGLREFPVLDNVVIYEGAMVAIDASGWARPARVVASNPDKIVGRAEARATNTGVGHANGAVTVRVRCDQIGLYNNSASADLIANKDIGAACYAADDQTVALTAQTSTYARAGKIHGIDAATAQVMVWFDQ
jgi:hypothetical protein